MTDKEIKERMERRKKRSFRRNHPDFPLHFSEICLVLVIFEPVVRKCIYHMLQVVQGLK